MTKTAEQIAAEMHERAYYLMAHGIMLWLIAEILENKEDK